MFAQARVFSQIPRAELAVLAEMMQTGVVPRGARSARSASRPIASTWWRAARSPSSLKNGTTPARLRAGDVLGEYGMVAASARTATVKVADEDAVPLARLRAPARTSSASRRPYGCSSRRGPSASSRRSGANCLDRDSSRDAREAGRTREKRLTCCQDGRIAGVLPMNAGGQRWSLHCSRRTWDARRGSSASVSRAESDGGFGKWLTA